MVAEHQKSQAKEQASQPEDESAVQENLKKLAQQQQQEDVPEKGGLKRQASMKKATAINIADVKEKDPVALAKLIEANKMKEEYEARVAEDMDDILNEKKQENTFKAEMKRYAKPTWKIVLGCISSAVVGSCATLFGWMIMEVMNDQNTAPMEGKDALDEAGVWLAVMAI